eukprot:6365678-Karenia_brevis.AAC.1
MKLLIHAGEAGGDGMATRARGRGGLRGVVVFIDIRQKTAIAQSLLSTQKIKMIDGNIDLEVRPCTVD